MRNLIIRSDVDKFPALTFRIRMDFQVDPYSKDPDPPVQMQRIQNPGYITQFSRLLFYNA